MNPDHVPVPKRDIQTLKTTGRPLFPLGQIVATPAALALLDRHAVRPAAVLSKHQHGEWGNLDAEDRATNDASIKNGERILSAYSFDGERLWVITEAQNGHGVRLSTCILLPEEY